MARFWEWNCIGSRISGDQALLDACWKPEAGKRASSRVNDPRCG
jgi:hypothetical protein